MADLTTSSPLAPAPTFTSAPTSMTTPNPRENRPNSDNTGANFGLATSATLYLYAFITTLVLVLLVSAAIISRSYVIRRRRRQFIEEAIRNGTLTGPSPHARFDPKDKPRLWDSHISAPDGQGSAWKVETPAEWETIKPLSVTFSVKQQKGTSKKARESVARTAGGGGDSLVDELMRDTNEGIAPLLQRWRRIGWTVLLGRQSGAGRPGTVLPLTQSGTRDSPLDPSNVAAVSSPRTAERKASSSSSDDGVVPSEVPLPRPAKVTVTLLVAMPTRHQTKSIADGEETPLPLLEIGVASVHLDVSTEDVTLVEGGRPSRPTMVISSGVIPPR